VRFNPVFYKHRDEYEASGEGEMLTDLPYRFVFAVCGVEGVAIYDTDETKPIAMISAIHYAAITDCAWSPDGSCLVVTSTDGYASLITFDAGELGEQARAEDVPAEVASMLPGARVSAAVERLAQKPTSMPVMQAPVRAMPAVEETAAPGEATQARRIAPTPMTE
jgi:chromatin assembly factor 1 subunit B